MTTSPLPLPIADSQTGLQVLKGLARDRSLLTALALMRQHVGRAFQITMPIFQPAVFCGPAASRQILVDERHKLLWRNESDPVVNLLRQGVLIVDGDLHDELRSYMEPVLVRRSILPHIPAFWHYTDQVIQTWADGETRDILVEMRKIALLILMGTLFDVDFSQDMQRLWHCVLSLLEYISPGLWILWPDMPRPKYEHPIQQMDEYLYAIIRQRRARLENSASPPQPGDLLGKLVLTPGMTDDLIRDQLLTMLIAGHDTSTALLAWCLYLLGSHPDMLALVRMEIDLVLEDQDEPPSYEQLTRLTLLDMVIKETLRLYPPIHIGNRRAAEDLTICGYHVPQGTRLMHSIYLSHRDEEYWPSPQSFQPRRFARDQENERPPLTYIPFGGGPRNCIGAAFAQVESRTILARLLQTFDLRLLNAGQIKPYMGATLEPRPGVIMRIKRRRF